MGLMDPSMICRFQGSLLFLAWLCIVGRDRWFAGLRVKNILAIAK
jgi:hypothetical protein